MHRADPHSKSPTPHGRARYSPHAGPASKLLQPPPEFNPAPQPLTPRPSRVMLRAQPQKPAPQPRLNGVWIRGYKIHAIDVIAAALAVAVLLAIFWPK